MVLISNNDPSERFGARHIKTLKEECDDIRTFRECGWFCILGYRGRDRLVHAHCDSREEYEAMMHGRLPHGAGLYGYHGCFSPRD